MLSNLQDDLALNNPSLVVRVEKIIKLILTGSFNDNADKFRQEYSSFLVKESK